MSEKLLFKDIKAKAEGKLLKTEYICRVYPTSTNGVIAFDNLDYKNNEKYISVLSYLDQHLDNETLILNEALSILFRDKKAIWNTLELNNDYEIEIAEIIHNEYEDGLTWADIKAL